MAHDMEPDVPSSDDKPVGPASASRLGLTLFAIYVFLYAGFMLLTVFKPRLLGATLAGVNIAILYGLGLILAAIVLALIYALAGRPIRD